MKCTDEDLFLLDRSGKKNSLSRRQKATINNRQLLKKISDMPEDIGSFKELRSFPIKQRQPKAILSKKKKFLQPYDIWADGDEKGISFEKEYFLKATKKLLPKRPKTLQQIPSLLPPVEVSSVGTSYNPPASDYQKYISSIVADEIQLCNEENKIQKALRIAPNECFVIKEDRMAEERAGLFDGDESNDEENDSGDKEITVNKSKTKTMKAKRKEKVEKRKRFSIEREKAVKIQENAIFSVKRFNKEIMQQLSEIEERAKLREEKKILKSLYGTKKLGRGKFAEPYQSFLLPEELPSSLCQLQPQDNIIAMRFKSMQKRNMLPVFVEKLKSNKKRRKLKFKHVEKRSHKEVTINSKVM
ncbi:unnamed protein product [Dracunculus medinensis]|uniref:Ribosome biogenesis protein NOP53 n=1 Tax=Dracunculus medinensis TaxID=318479 RepID=A0A158Q676_DRAME|nr:unnamed protein product [Dracunculus medinensis]